MASISEPVILALDPGASCGYAVLRVDRATRTARITAYGFVDVDTSSTYDGDWCIDLARRLDELHASIKFTELAIENYYFSKRTCCGADINMAYRAAIRIWARQRAMHYQILNIGDWKRHVTGRSTPTLEQKARWGVSAKKLAVAEALWTRHGVRFPNHSISEKTGRPIEFRMDCVDAVAQGVYASFAAYACMSVLCDVPVPADFAFAKPSRTRLDYATFGAAETAPPPKRRTRGGTDPDRAAPRRAARKPKKGSEQK